MRLSEYDSRELTSEGKRGRIWGMPHKSTCEDKAPSGSKARVLADIVRYVENPDAPMVPHGLAGQLANTRNMDISPSKLFEDNGHKLNAVAYLAERGRVARIPKTREGLVDSLGEFFSFCGENHVPPTLGGFAVWNGVSVQRVNQLERDKSNGELSEAITLCKDSIRNFLEMAAIDSSLNPIIYFHMNKVYYGAVENQVIQFRTEDNSSELSPEERAERVAMLVQQPDGTFAEEID